MFLLYFFAAIVVVNCLYYLFFLRFSFSKINLPTTKNTFAVSVIVCAKNEAKNLSRNIPLLLAQNHPDFEIVLVNDASIDKTLDIMEAYAKKYPKITIVNVKNNEAFWGNKKYALTLGIKKAKHERLLFIDADCKPLSKDWITAMTSAFSEEKQLVLGYGAYAKSKGLLNKIIRFETLLTALQYFSFAKSGIPYMGVGRNLGYTKTLFFKNNGFMSHMDIRSGDDDLFVNEASTKKNTTLCFSENSFTISSPKKSFIHWFQQKRRHVTTASHYKSKHKFLLGLFFITNLLFWVGTFSVFFLFDWKIPLILIIFRMLLYYFSVGKSAFNLKEKDTIPLFPFLEIFLICTQLTIFIYNSINKRHHWK